jgi:NAD-dependent dihydropyrimidine dehydrogenase PreA subunit
MDRRLVKARISKLAVPRRYYHKNPLKIPFIARQVEKWLFAGDDLICLTRDNVIEVGQPVEDPGNLVLPSQVVEPFIKKACYRLIMNKCLCRDACTCKDYPMDFGCIFLGEAARGIHPDLGREAGVEECLDHLERCRQAGLVHIVGKAKLDTVWLDICPGEKLFTICNCCPCCCISRGIPYYDPLLGEKFYRLPGVTVSITDECEGCGACAEGVCMYHAISMSGDRAVINQDRCKGCGRCTSECPNHAIKVTVEDHGYVQETIQRLAGKVDVT